MPAHQSLDATAAHLAAQGSQLGMNARAAITPGCIATNPFDVDDELPIGGSSLALRARTPGIIAGWRDPEHVAQDPHRIVGAPIFDEAESHFGTPAKIAIDFFKMSRSMRSRSFSRCKRATSAAWSADGSVACVVGRRAAAVGSRPASRRSTQRRKRNRAGQASWRPTRSSGRSMPPDQPLAAYSRL
nr:hypothetical protein [Bradyrhizobium sp. 190]